MYVLTDLFIYPFLYLLEQVLISNLVFYSWGLWLLLTQWWTLHLHLWNVLFIVDLDNDVPFFLTWLNVIKGFFFTMEWIVWSFTDVISSRRLGFLGWTFHSALYVPQNVPNLCDGHS